MIELEIGQYKISSFDRYNIGFFRQVDVTHRLAKGIQKYKSSPDLYFSKLDNALLHVRDRLIIDTACNTLDDLRVLIKKVNQCIADLRNTHYLELPRHE